MRAGRDGDREDILPTAVCGGRIAYAVAWDVGITVFSDFHWTDAVARQYITACIELTEARSTLGGRGGLTYLAGAPPGPSQRAIIVGALRAKGVALDRQRSVIVSDSHLVRAAATALAFLTGSDTKTFATTALAPAVSCAAFDDPALARRVDAYLWRCLSLVGLRRPS